MTTRERTARNIVTACVLALFACILASAPVRAHATLVASTPLADAVVLTPPERVSLEFNEAVSPLVVTLIRPDGSRSAPVRIVAQAHLLDVVLPQDLSDGTHVLSWRVVSADGHPMAGTLMFSIGAPSPTPPDADTATDPALRAAILAAKVALYLGLFFGVGGAFALMWLGNGEPTTARATILPLLVTGLAGAVLSVGLLGLDAYGAPLDRLFEATFWRAGAMTTFVFTAIIAVAAFVLALAALAIRPHFARPLSLAAFVGIGLALALSGHAAAAEPRWLTRSMVFLHATGVAFWVGALIPFGLALRQGSPGAALMLERFSGRIPWVLAVLVIAGGILAFIQAEHPSALMETAYGRLLSLKLLLILGLLALAAFNRWRLTAGAACGLPGPRQQMARIIGFEAAIVVLVLALVAGWRFTPPPRALSIAAAQPASIHIHTLPAMADLTVSPGRAGETKVTIAIMTGEYGPLPADAVDLTFATPSGEAKVRTAATKHEDGTWRIDRFEIPSAGTWSATLEIRPRASDPILLTDAIVIRP